MYVKDVLCKVAELVGEEDIASVIKSSGVPTSEQTKKINMMLEGFNTVLREIALDYSPLKNKETFSNKIVNFSTFAYTPTKILSVASESGKEIDAFVFATYIKFNEVPAVVEYSYIPTDKVLNDVFDYEKSFFGAIVFAYGTAVEYSIINGQYERAVAYESKYRALLSTSPLKKVKRIKGRKDWGL